MFDEPNGGKQSLVAANDTPCDETLTYRVREIYSGEEICSGITTVPADSSASICDIPAAEQESKFYFIEWKLSDGRHGSNHHMTQTQNTDAVQTLKAIAACGYDCFEGF